MTTYPNISEVEEELPGIEMDNNDDAEMESHEPDQGKDLSELAEISVENADKGEINEDIPMKQKHNETVSQVDPNHESENQCDHVKEEKNKCDNNENKVICEDERKHEIETEQQL